MLRTVIQILILFILWGYSYTENTNGLLFAIGLILWYKWYYDSK